MRIHFSYQTYQLRFKFDARTSRGAMKDHQTHFIFLTDAEGITGVGEAAPLPGLSPEHTPHFTEKIEKYGNRFENIDSIHSEKDVFQLVREKIPADFPSLRFAFEVALLDLFHGGRKLIFENDFSAGKKKLPINGLIWMGDLEFMQSQVLKKMDEGFNCIKMKIGAIDFEKELDLLSSIRQNYDPSTITLRVDANGAFSVEEGEYKLNALARLGIHSIEQPIDKGQWPEMKKLCAKNVIPIALDEELIGIFDIAKKKKMLDSIQPQFIILKPTLHGGLQGCREWIELAELRNIGWWVTSALESNIGLNAICQFTAQYPVNLPQGLGTGQLYHNNIESPLTIRQGEIYIDPDKKWDSNQLND